MSSEDAFGSMNNGINSWVNSVTGRGNAAVSSAGSQAQIDAFNAATQSWFDNLSGETSPDGSTNNPTQGSPQKPKAKDAEIIVPPQKSVWDISDIGSSSLLVSVIKVEVAVFAYITNLPTDGVSMSAIWNSAIVRAETGDVLKVSFAYSAIGGVGSGGSLDFNWIIHGQEASYMPLVTHTSLVGFGGDVGLYVNVSQINYSGDIESFKSSMLITDTRNGDAPTIFGSGGLAEGLKVDGFGSMTYLNKENGGFLMEFGVSFGVAVPTLGPWLPVEGAIGVSNTFPIYGSFK